MIRVPLTALFLLAAPLLAGCADDVTGHDDGRWLVTSRDGETDYEMGDRVLFQTGSADVSNRAYDIIASVAADARRHPRAMVEVDGYTDTAGTHEYNMGLSQSRAENVADILVRHGVASRRVVARGFGESHLAVATGNGVKEARNRRVVIRILAQRDS